MFWKHLFRRRFLLAPDNSNFFNIRFFSLIKNSSKMATTTTTRNICSSSKKDEIIVVTGASGFLGQHVVHLLQTREKNIKEIRLFDSKPFQKFLDYEDVKPVQEILGDICNPDQVRSALREAHAVIHIAGLISFDTFPKIQQMNKINVSGTENILKICLEENVERLIFCSTVDVVIGFEEILNGTEDTTSTPKKFLFPGYPESKSKAEELVLKANGKILQNGQTFHTVSLRPNVMYGEGDPFMITSALKAAQDSYGWVVKVGDGSALFQKSYVGNVAWAFLKANQVLQKTPQNIGGHFFFVPDATPVKNIFDSLEPFLVDRNFRVTPFSIPYSLIRWIFQIRDLFLWIISFVHKFHLTPLCSITYINMTLVFKGDKAQRMLGYQPIFTPEESIRRSKIFYNNLKLK